MTEVIFGLTTRETSSLEENDHKLTFTAQTVKCLSQRKGSINTIFNQKCCCGNCIIKVSEKAKVMLKWFGFSHVEKQAQVQD